AGLIIAFSSALIAYIRYQKYVKFEKIKFRTSQYEKRYKVFKAVKNMTSYIMTGLQTPKGWQDFLDEYHKTDEAKFIFNGDEDIENFIEEIYHNANKAYTANKILNTDTQLPEKRIKQQTEKYGEVLDWVENKFTKANKLFEPYLRLQEM